MNKRAGWIAFITFVLLVLLAVFKLERYTYVAFVAFPLGLAQQGVTRKTASSQWRIALLLENIGGLVIGLIIAVMLSIFGTSFVYIALTVLATYFVGLLKPTVATTIFATIGMMYATNMQSLVVSSMLLGGFVLSQIATMNLEKIERLFKKKKK